MLAASCCAAVATGAAGLLRAPSRQPSLRLPAHQLQPAPRQATGRQRLHTVRAFREGHNGGARTVAVSPDQVHATKMINLCLEYFDELMSKGNVEVCHKILDPRVQHKDMVRNEGRFGISEYQHFVKGLKQAYPNIYVRPTQFGVVDNHTLFVAFEGRATEQTPMFKGVDLFHFNDSASKIREIDVYRSNWLGAQGHEERKRAAQQVQPQPRLTT